MPPRKQKVEEATATYPFVSVQICASPDRSGMSEERAGKISDALSMLGLVNLPIDYRGPLTAEDMIRLLGFEWEKDDGPKFGTDYLFTDYHGKKVRSTKNVRNRPVTTSNYQAIEQDYLRGKWELNGETMIFGRTGVAISVQHRGIALIRAQQRLESEKDMDSKESRWASQWPTGKVSIPAILVFGIEESDRVINTVDTAKPRTLADVLYRSPYFANLPPKGNNGLNRETAARICDHAIKQIWLRTGIYVEPFSQIRTHSEAITWLEGHGGMKGHFVKCVRHIMEENGYQVTDQDADGADVQVDKSGKISRYVPLGYATAMMWLMSCSSTPSDDVETYYGNDERTESLLTWDKETWSSSVEFWSEFGKKESDSLAYLHKGLDGLLTEENSGDGINRFREKDYAICKAWRQYRDGEDMTSKSLKVEKGTDEGKVVLLNYTPVGGIDLGNLKIRRANPADGLEPTEEMREEVENGIEELRNGHTPTPSANGSAESKSAVSQILSEEAAILEKRRKPRVDTEKPSATSLTQPTTMKDIVEKLHADNPDYGPLFLQSSLKNWIVWGEDAEVVGGIVSREPKMHATGILHLSFKPADAEVAADNLTDKGVIVGFAAESEGKWSIVRTFKPSAPEKAPTKRGRNK